MELPFEPERTVVYYRRRWKLFETMREKGAKILEDLRRIRLEGLLYGSVARGDVREGSDVDIVVLKHRFPLSLVEDFSREILGDPVRREIVQSTPTGAIKAYIHFDDNVAISFPLSPLRQREEGFYRFGGAVGLKELEMGVRVPGVTKKLVLVYPFEKGHHEAPVAGKEGLVASILGISKGVVDERVRVLGKRREKGTTGVYLKHELMLGEPFEEALKRLVLEKKGMRERLAGII